MGRLRSFSLQNGTDVLIEVDDLAGPTVTRGLTVADTIEKVGGSFETALDRLRPAVALVVDKFRTLPNGPGEVTVEFGVKFAAEAGAFIASASSEAQFKIKMVWKREAAS